ncbi:hypothetical protein [Taibaiella soli]|uniref:Uncharacterized protein n=1 Tax=Taibaiella soli TaxID=1649169 RepID=A0A2W2AGC5_9BACT|nr:hypothetical protein [Taibaiella soli]PZF72572.1 hypothetical protein DN068_11955 [Taibaiella soli]
MSSEYTLDQIPVAGKLPKEELMNLLSSLGEDIDQQGEQLKGEEGVRKDFFLNLFGQKAWIHTGHSFGFLPPSEPGSEFISIRHAGNIEADQNLKNTRIKVTLDRLRVADYPGSGQHLVLFDFYAQNQLPGTIEHLHFTNTYTAREGEQAGIIGYPVFVGLNVGTEGIAFRCFTVNVKNESDEKFLSFLDSDVFKSGLELSKQLQPAIAPLSKMALGISEAIAKRNRNVPVQSFYMGLDFSKISTRARLREGSYIAVQIPETLVTAWDWDEWVFNPSNGQLVHADEPTKLIPYNYIVFGISRYE